MSRYRLPDGTLTKSSAQHISAWRKLSKPIEDLTGMRHTGFDPDVGFYSSEEKRTISLPVWFLDLVNRSLRGEKKPEKTKAEIDYDAEIERVRAAWKSP